LDVPFGDMVYQVASAIATSQAKLDGTSIELLKIMGNVDKAPVSLPLLDDDDSKSIKTSMIGAGFQPTFYQFSDAIIEVKMAITMSRENEYSSTSETEYGPSTTTSFNLRNFTIKQSSIKSSTINASYTSKYNFTEEASSTLRVRLVPLPPNPIIQRFIELRAQKEQLKYEIEMKKVELEMQKMDAANQKEIEKLSKTA